MEDFVSHFISLYFIKTVTKQNKSETNYGSVMNYLLEKMFLNPRSDSKTPHIYSYTVFTIFKNNFSSILGLITPTIKKQPDYLFFGFCKDFILLCSFSCKYVIS